MGLFLNRQFSCLIGAQFLAALNDNFLKQLFLLIVVQSALGGEAGVDYQLQGAGTAVFALPFLLFSSVAGNLSDRLGKGYIVRATKFLELFVAGLATLGLFFDSLVLLVVALLLLSTQSCFFSPAKYGILPELLPRSDLSRGNGILQMTTYLAILLGTASAGITLTLFENARMKSGYFMIGIAVLGWILSFGVRRQQPQDPGRTVFEFPIEQLVRGLGRILEDTHLALAVLNFVFVWFLGTILMANMNVFGMAELGLSPLWTSLLNVFLAVGLGLGSYLAGMLSGDNIRPDFVPAGGFLLACCLVGLVFSSDSIYGSVGLIFTVGVGGGFFLIPVQTMTQDRPPERNRGEVLGSLNFFTFAGVLLASAGYTLVVGYFELAAPMIMVLLGIFSFLVSGFLIVFFPRYRPFQGSSIEEF